MDQYRRPATLDDLKLLLRSLNEQVVDRLLISVCARAVHGYENRRDLHKALRSNLGADDARGAASPVAPQVTA